MKNDDDFPASAGASVPRAWRRARPMHTAQFAIAISALLLGTPAVFAAPDGPGQQLAMQGVPGKVAACSSCHGPNGEGSAAFPYLRGTGQEYLLAQLESFASGTRKNSLMQPIAQALSPAQRSAVAAYYSRIPPPDKVAVETPTDPTQAGAWLAARGRWKDDLPACAQCHGPGGRGVGSRFPPLAGLPKTYIITQLQAWRSGSRPPGPLGLMAMVAGKLSEADIQAVSTHYANLGAESGK